MENRRHGHSPGQRPSTSDRNRSSAGRSQGDGNSYNRGPRANGDGRTRSTTTGRDPDRSYGRSRRPAAGPGQRRSATDGRFDAGLNRGKKRLHKPPAKEPPQIKITSDDQITDGKFRGSRLINTVSARTSHTDRKLREILFKIIARRVKGRRLLDLGAGCGMIGIEGISRGIMLSSFVERSPRMCGFVKKNLKELGIKDGHGEVTELEVAPFLKRAAKSKRVWDLVFLGTRNVDDEAVFGYLRRGVSVEQGGLLIIEHDAATEFPEKLGSLGRWRVIANGDVSLTLYERK